MLAQRLPSPFKSGCMWGVLDDCTLWCWILWLIAGWPGVHVQPHCRNGSPDHAQGFCHSRLAHQPCPPDVPGIYEVGCVCVSLGDWEVQLSEDSVKTLLFSRVLCLSTPWVLVSVVVLPVDLIRRDALPDSGTSHFLTAGKDFSSSPESSGTFIPATFLTLSSLWIHCMLASVTDQFPKHKPGHGWHRVKSLLCDLQISELSLGFWQCSRSCKCVRNRNSCIAGPVLASPDLCCSKPWRWPPIYDTESLWAPVQAPPCCGSRWSWRLRIQHWFPRSYRYNCHLLVGWESLLASCLVLK